MAGCLRSEIPPLGFNMGKTNLCFIRMRCMLTSQKVGKAWKEVSVITNRARHRYSTSAIFLHHYKAMNEILSYLWKISDEHFCKKFCFTHIVSFISPQWLVTSYRDFHPYMLFSSVLFPIKFCHYNPLCCVSSGTSPCDYYPLLCNIQNPENEQAPYNQN